MINIRIEILYYSIILILAFFGIYLIKNEMENRNKLMKFKKNKYKQVLNYVKVQLDKKEIDRLFAESGLKITTLNYQIWRHIVFFIWLMFLIYAQIQNNSVSIREFIFISVMYVATNPIEKIFGRKAPFTMMIDFLAEQYKKKKDLEVYMSISQLKNLSIAQQDNPVGADFIIEQLSKSTNLTKLAYIKALSLWRTGKEEEAIKKFGDEIDTRMGRDFGNILLKLDELNPFEFKEQLEIFQNTIKSERSTERQKKNEAISNWIYTPAVVSAMVILLNFVVVVVFIDNMNLLNNL